MVSFFKALTSAFTCKNLSIINQGTKCGVVSSPEIGRLVFQDLHAVYWADPGTYSLLSCPAPGLSAARGWVFWPGQCGNSLPPPLALSLTSVDICTVLYYTVLYVANSRENKALWNTKAEILYTFCRCIVFFWLFTFYNAQQQKLYCFNNVQCTFMDLNSSSDFRLK